MAPRSKSGGSIELEVGACVEMYIQTKLSPNEFVRPALKARGPRRGALEQGVWGEPGVFHLFGLGQVTPRKYGSLQRKNPKHTKAL